jgi:hypothetical protein
MNLSIHCLHDKNMARWGSQKYGPTSSLIKKALGNYQTQERRIACVLQSKHSYSIQQLELRTNSPLHHILAGWHATLIWNRWYVGLLFKQTTNVNLVDMYIKISVPNHKSTKNNKCKFSFHDNISHISITFSTRKCR